MKEIMNKREKAFHPAPGKTNLVLHSIVTDSTSQETHAQSPGNTSGPSTQGAQVDAQARNYRAINQSLVTRTCACQEVKDDTNGGTSVQRLSTYQCGHSPRALLDATDRWTSGQDRECEIYFCLWSTEEILSCSDERRGLAKDSLYVHNVYEDAFWVERGIHNLSEVNGHPTWWNSPVCSRVHGRSSYILMFMGKHLQYVDEILQWFERANLTLRAEKCNISAARCIFLGHEVGRGHVAPVQTKIEAIQRFNRPITKKDVRSFLGLTGYYQKFIKDYATIALPLTDLLMEFTRPSKMEWGTDRAFEQLKQVIVEKPVLRTPGLTKDFILQTYASGGYLLQIARPWWQLQFSDSLPHFALKNDYPHTPIVQRRTK